MAISLTPAAADRVRHFLAERGHGVGLNEAFRFRNPNVRGECGCGESFSV